MMSVSYSSRRERSISNPRRQSGDSDPPPYPPLSVPEGRALSLPAPWGTACDRSGANPRRQSGDPQASLSSQRPGGTLFL